MSEHHLSSSLDDWLESVVDEEDEVVMKKLRNDFRSSHNTERAYAYDTAPKDCDPYNYMVVDNDDETLKNLSEWKECMSMEHKFYKNNCPYCTQGDYIGLKCPGCERWHIALHLDLHDEVKKKHFKEKRAIELSRQKKREEYFKS